MGKAFVKLGLWMQRVWCKFQCKWNSLVFEPNVAKFTLYKLLVFIQKLNLRKYLLSKHFNYISQIIFKHGSTFNHQLLNVCKRDSLVFEPNVANMINTSNIIQIACIYFEIKFTKYLLSKYFNYIRQIIFKYGSTFNQQLLNVKGIHQYLSQRLLI